MRMRFCSASFLKGTLCSQVQGSDLPAGARNERHEPLTQHANTGWVIVAHAQLSDLLLPRILAAYSKAALLSPLHA
jgi:hypothetical protein